MTQEFELTHEDISELTQETGLHVLSPIRQVGKLSSQS